MSFSRFLATNCVSWNDELCMIRPTIIDLNPVEIYPFMIGFDKCAGSCSVLSPNQCVQKETKDINVIAFNMIQKKAKQKQCKNIFHVILNVNSIAQHVIQIRTEITKHVNVDVKIIICAKKIIVWIPADVFVRIASI